MGHFVYKVGDTVYIQHPSAEGTISKRWNIGTIHFYLVKTRDGEYYEREESLINVRYGNPIELAQGVYGHIAESEEEAKSFVARRLYKDTGCGISTHWYDDGLEVSAIVEGYDAEFTATKLEYPFTEYALDQAVLWLEVCVDEFLVGALEE